MQFIEKSCPFLLVTRTISPTNSSVCVARNERRSKGTEKKKKSRPLSPTKKKSTQMLNRVSCVCIYVSRRDVRKRHTHSG